VYFRADSKYTVVRTEDGEALIEESLQALEQEFGEEFIRIHRNALVAAKRIARLQKLSAGSMGLSLAGVPDILEISRRHVPEIRARLKRLGKGDGCAD
jgi:two-component system response regulator AlgR